jgi:biopolymer transport protein ExbB/TolQ
MAIAGMSVRAVVDILLIFTIAVLLLSAVWALNVPSVPDELERRLSKLHSRHELLAQAVHNLTKGTAQLYLDFEQVEKLLQQSAAGSPQDEEKRIQSSLQAVKDEVASVIGNLSEELNRLNDDLSRL